MRSAGVHHQYMTDDRPSQPEDIPPGPGPTGASSAEPPPPLTAFAWRNGLVRPAQGRLLAGVCGALARSTNTDPILWRVIIAVLTIFGGFGVLLYLLGWLLLPADGDTASPVEAVLGRGQSATSTTLTIIAALVALISVGAFVSEPFRPGIIGAVLLGAAALLLLRDQRGRGRPVPAPPMPSMGTAPAAAAPVAGAPMTGAAEPASDDLGAPSFPAPSYPGPSSVLPPSPFPPRPPVAPPLYGPQPPYGPQAPFAPRGPFAPGGLPPQPPQPPQFTPRPQQPKPPKSRLGRLTFSLLLIVVGALIGIDLGYRPVPTAVYVAGALGVVALGLIIGAWFGRARGLIALGIVLSLVLTTVAGFGRLDRGWRGGTVTWAPTSLTQLQSSYGQDAGDVRLDLTNLDFSTESNPVNLETRVDVGSIKILLPPNVDVIVDANVDVGSADVLGQKWDGLGLDSRTVEDHGADGVGGGTLHIEAQVDLGDLEVTR